MWLDGLYMAQPFRVEAILDEMSEENVPEARIIGNLKKIDRYFASDRLEEILESLDAGAAEGDEWARTEADTIRKKSPMQGACSGCPSSAITLKRGIEGLIKHYVPEVETIEAI